MALIDHPDRWILRLFEMAQGEGEGDACERYSEGLVVPDLDFETGERVYGICRKKYFFTPLALVIRETSGPRRIAWKSVVRCSGYLRDGKQTATLTLSSGEKTRVRVGDFPYKIAQLFYQMIEQHGSPEKKCRFGGPPHLKGVVGDVSADVRESHGLKRDEQLWQRILSCQCGNEMSFRVRYLGERLDDGLIRELPDVRERIETECCACGRHIGLFDPFRHGYDVCIAGDYQEEPPGRQADSEYTCPCGGRVFRVVVQAGYDVDPEELREIDRSLWDSSFGWFCVFLTCEDCGRFVKAVDCECA